MIYIAPLSGKTRGAFVEDSLGHWSFRRETRGNAVPIVNVFKNAF